MRTEANVSGKHAHESTEGVPDAGCRKFLRALLQWDGAAEAKQLGPQTSQDENRARQKCKRRGWATYDGGNVGYWRLTDAGRDALKRSIA